MAATSKSTSIFLKVDQGGTVVSCDAFNSEKNPHELTGKPLSDLFGKRHQKKLAQLIKQVSQSGDRLEWQCALPNKQRALVQLFATSRSRPAKQVMICGSVLQQQSDHQTLLYKIAEDITESSGDRFYQLLVRYLVESLSASHAFIADLKSDPNEVVETLAVFGDGHYHSQFSFPLKQSVFESAFDGDVLIATGNKLKEPLEPELLHHWNARVVVGMPLYGANKQRLGIVVVVFARAIKNTKLIESTMKIYAARVASELERQRMSESLTVSEQRARLFAKEQEEMMFHWLPDGTRTYVDEGYSRHMGESREKLIGGNLMAAIVPEDRDNIDRALSALTPDNPVFVEEYRTRLRNGELRRTRWVDRAFFNHKGNIKFVQSVGRELRESRRADEEAATYQAMLNKALHQSGIGVWFWDAESKKLRVTGNLEQMVDVENPTLFGFFKSFSRKVHTADRARLKTKLRQFLRSRQAISVDVRIVSDNLDPQWYSLCVEPVLDDARHWVGMTGTLQNVTARLNAENALKESERNLRLIVSHSPDVIMRIDYDGTIRFINYTVPEYTPSQVIGTPVYDYLSEHDSGLYKAALKTLEKENKPCSFDITSIGETSWYVRLIPVPGDAVTGEVLVIATNATENTQIKHALKQSREQYSLAQRVANIGGWEWDLKTNQMAWSETLEPMFGLKYGDFGGTFNDYLDLVYAQDRRQVEVILARSIQNRNIIQLEHRIRWPNDEIRWILINAEVSENNDKQPSKVIGIMQDVTRFKMAQKALIASEQRWRTVVKNAPDFIAMISQSGKILYANRALPEYDINMVIGSSIFGFTPASDHSLIRDAIMRVFVDKSIASYKTSHVDSLGKRRYFRTRLAPLLTQGEVEAAILIASDITDDVATKSRLKESQDRFQLLVEQSQDGHWDWPDTSVNTMWWSPRFYRMLNLDPDTVQASVDSLLKIIHPEDQPTVRRFLSVSNDSGEKFDIQLRIRLSEDHSEWFQLRGKSIERADSGFRVSGSLQNVNSMLEKRELLEELVSERTRALEAANRELESFSYSVSHDLRAPLRSIDGFSKMLLEDYTDLFDSTAMDYITRVRNSAQRMGDLIDDLLKLSRVTSSHFEKEYINVSRIVQIIHSRTKRDQPGRRVETTIQDGLYAYADKKLLTIALENLFSNAWKYTTRNPSAKIEFGAMQAGEQVVYYLRDNGAGFDMRYADRLFSAFQRLHSEKEYPGTGIGLATVHRIIRRHGGEIWVDSKLGEGTEFYFTIDKEADAQEE